MAVWATSESGLDWQLAQNGFCSAFHRRTVLDEAVAWLAQSGDRIVRFDAAGWVDPRVLHDDVAAGLDFPGYYGRNLDALNDCLGDVAELAYGWTAADRGLVLVLDRFDAFQLADAATAGAILDMVEDAGRRAALFGNRLLCLVHSDDPDIKLAPVGGRAVQWNPAEWLRSRRSPDA
ncbi:barstar family protein [Leifsonia sp. NPDC080035]|uniref:Barstar family protein n=1 Tax=Leifsonia sp. NPDC080035 TaxID=3143936 RepID=A0AAU7G9X9_9MICO